VRFAEPYGLLLLAFVPLFLLLLSLSLRRRRTTIPSYHLIREVIDSLPQLPKSFLLRRKIQIVLFLAAVTLAALAAAGPLAGSSEEGDPVTAVIALDHLSHWKDPREPEAGWESVLERARSVVRRLRGGDRVLIVRTDRGAVTRGFASPRRAASLLGKLSPSERPISMEEAADYLRLIEDLHRPDFVAIITPSPSRWKDALPERGPSWRIIRSAAPPPGPNYGILDVEIRPDLLRPGRFSLYCRVGAFAAANTGTEVTATLSVRWGEEQLASKSLSLKPGDSRGVVLPDLAAGAGLLTVQLEPMDGFPGDNTYLTPIRRRPPLETVLTTTGNHALESALRSIPGLSLSIAEPGDAGPGGVPLVTVYDRIVPRGWEGNALVIHPITGMSELAIVGETIFPKTVSADESHPLMKGVTFESLKITRLPILIPGLSLHTIARADGYPLLLAGETYSGGRMAVLAFDPVADGWIYDPSFPILMANLVSWLGMESPGTRSSFLVGDTIADGILEGSRAITGPAGRVTRPSAGNWSGFSFPLAGRYQVAAGRGKRSGEIFVNIVNESVSRSMTVSAEDVGDALPSSLLDRPFRIEMRGLLLAAAIVLLLLESIVAPSARVGRLPE
jgi:hypothetical protein